MVDNPSFGAFLFPGGAYTGRVVSSQQAAGGLIRGADGEWLGGFTCNFCWCTNMAAELFGARQGLQLAWEKGFRRVVLELDASTAIQRIEDPVDLNHHYGSLISDCKELMSRDWDCRLSHTLREGNACASFFSKAAANDAYGLRVLESPPEGLRSLLFNDVIGIEYQDLLGVSFVFFFFPSVIMIKKKKEGRPRYFPDFSNSGTRMVSASLFCTSKGVFLLKKAPDLLRLMDCPEAKQYLFNTSILGTGLFWNS